MTFNVQPSYLDCYAAQVGRGADDATSVKRLTLPLLRERTRHFPAGARAH